MSTNFTNMESEAGISRLITLVRGTPNRGKVHLFLGNPISDGCDKTTVEPGNNFSPGVWTCGVSIWFVEGEEISTPDLLPESAIEWGFAPEMPLLESRYTAGSFQVTHRMVQIGGEGSVGVDYCTVEITANAPVTNAFLYIVVRDTGAAGAKIENITLPEAILSDSLLINGTIRLLSERTVSKRMVIPADSLHDSPLGLLRFDLPPLSAGEIWSLSFKVMHGWSQGGFAISNPPVQPLTAEAAFEKSRYDWEFDLPAHVFCPDPRINRTWEQCAYHLLAAMECGQPRIGAVNYPIFWMRDSVIILRALDTIGRHDLAHLGCDSLVPMIFSGGFGAEADAPGQGIWALVNHARRTHDLEWLRMIFPQIVARTQWIDAMIHAPHPLREVTENRLPRYLNIPDINLVCLAAEKGLIRGRMDWHMPDFYINCWALCGLRMAIQAEEMIGTNTFTPHWKEHADALEAAIVQHLLPQFGNERDLIVTPHPAGVLFPEHADTLRTAFERQYRKYRLNRDETRRREPLWSYFEVAQAHNALLLDLPSLAWTTLDGMLNDGGKWDVSLFGEGEPNGNEHLPYHNDLGGRGWLNRENARNGNMPHNWTNAEMLLLIRNMFVIESENALLLGHGIPVSWYISGATFGVRNMPTNHGVVSYTATVREDGSIALEYDGPLAYHVAFHRNRG